MNDIIFRREIVGQESLQNFKQNMASLHRPAKILIVDDNRDDVEMLKNQLKHFDCVIDVAYDGKSAVKLLSEVAFDFMLLDIKLNGFSGLDVLKSCAALSIRVPVIVLTGAHSDDSLQAQEAFKLGALFVAMKPLRDEQLQAIFARQITT